MKATDLMIGDWVSQNNKPKKVIVNWGRDISLYDQSKEIGSIYSDKFAEEDKCLRELYRRHVRNDSAQRELEGAYSVSK